VDRAGSPGDIGHRDQVLTDGGDLEAGRLDLLDRGDHSGERVGGFPVEVGVTERAVAFHRYRGIVAAGP